MNIDKEAILIDLAPCGIDCSRCAVYKGGVIQESSILLKEALTNFEKKAEAFSGMVPAFRNYKDFTKILDFFTNASCRGCRNGDSKNPSCSIKTCFREKGVDFCFECEDFPCNRNNFNDELYKKWIRINNTMKDIGVETYYKDSKYKPRY